MQSQAADLPFDQVEANGKRSLASLRRRGAFPSETSQVGVIFLFMAIVLLVVAAAPVLHLHVLCFRGFLFFGFPQRRRGSRRESAHFGPG